MAFYTKFMWQVASIDLIVVVVVYYDALILSDEILEPKCPVGGLN